MGTVDRPFIRLVWWRRHFHTGLNNMNKVLEQAAVIFGGLGLVVAAIAGGGRLLGLRAIANFEGITLLVGAIALMVASCMIQLHLLRKERS